MSKRKKKQKAEAQEWREDMLKKEREAGNRYAYTIGTGVKDRYCGNHGGQKK